MTPLEQTIKTLVRSGFMVTFSDNPEGREEGNRGPMLASITEAANPRNVETVALASTRADDWPDRIYAAYRDLVSRRRVPSG